LVSMSPSMGGKLRAISGALIGIVAFAGVAVCHK
jgi:hypothetical protein